MVIGASTTDQLYVALIDLDLPEWAGIGSRGSASTVGSSSFSQVAPWRYSRDVGAP